MITPHVHNKLQHHFKQIQLIHTCKKGEPAVQQLWGMRATVACQVQSNPRDPSSMTHDYIQFRNHALVTVQMPSKSVGKNPAWKRETPSSAPTPPPRVYERSGKVD